MTAEAKWSALLADIEVARRRHDRTAAAYAEGERRYWYFVSETYCPACGRTEALRERVYGERPERWEDRHERDESYDYCDAL